MKRAHVITFSALLLAGTAAAQDTARTGPEPAQALGKVTLGFEANVGQTDPRVKYFARGNGYTAFLTANEAVLALTKRTLKHNEGAPSELAGGERALYDTALATVRMEFEDANAQPVATASGPMRAHISCLSAGGSARLQPTLYEKASYAEVWPGVSVVFYRS